MTTVQLASPTQRRVPGPWDGATAAPSVATALVGAAAALSTAPAVAHPGLRLVLVLVAVAAVTDIQSMRIPNVISAAAGVVAMGCWAVSGASLWPMVITLAFSVACVAGYLLAGLGGGDVKLLPPILLALVAPFPDPVVGFLLMCGFVSLTAAAALLTHLISGAGRGPSPVAPGMLIGGLGTLVALQAVQHADLLFPIVS